MKLWRVRIDAPDDINHGRVVRQGEGDEMPLGMAASAGSWTYALGEAGRAVIEWTDLRWTKWANPHE